MHAVCEAKVKQFLYRRGTGPEGSWRLRLPDFEMCILISISIPTRPTDSHLKQCFSTFVRSRLGKFFFLKTRALFQQIYS